MQCKKLGKLDFLVSELCFGSLTVGPLQKDFSPEYAGKIISFALDSGVNFIDTAELYENYPHIKCGIEKKRDVIIASKSYAYEYDDMLQSIQTACKQLDREYIDIFALHEQTSRLTLKGHGEALKCLVDAKQKGLIRAIGISTHFVDVVRAAAMMDEVDVIQPIINQKGFGIADGSCEDMLKAIDFAHYMGKGIYAMKALGGGYLSGSSKEAIDWVRKIKPISSVAVGMQSIDEVIVNCALFSDKLPDEQKLFKIINQKRDIIVEPYCTGCGNCEKRCKNGAVEVIDSIAVIDKTKCLRCGYCSTVCEHFCIKVV